jgi:hypothetical protein
VAGAFFHAQQQAVAHREQQGHLNGGGDHPDRHQPSAAARRLGPEEQQQQQGDVQGAQGNGQAQTQNFQPGDGIVHGQIHSWRTRNSTILSGLAGEGTSLKQIQSGDRLPLQG